MWNRGITGRLKIHRHKEIKLNINLGCSVLRLEVIKANKSVLRLVTGRLKIHRLKEIKLNITLGCHVLRLEVIC